MSLLHISLFSKFRVEFSDQIVSGIESQKTQEFLSYLLLYRNRLHSRESLADLLWPDNLQAKAYLRRVLWQIQSTLGECDDAAKEMLLVDANWIQINTAASFWLDISCFEQTFALVKGVSGTDFSPETARQVQEAVDLYSGDLLQGWYLDWCILERERYQQMFLSMLDKLMAYEKAKQNYEVGWTYGMTILRYDPLREHTHRELMALYYLAGNRSESLKQYHRCAALLDKELGVRPAYETESLYRQLKGNTLPPAVFPQRQLTNDRTVDHETSLQGLLKDLKQIQTALAVIQERVQHEIQLSQSGPRK